MTETVTPAIRDEKFLTVAEAERRSRLSHDSLDRLAKRGEPVGRLKAGGRVLYDRAQLEAWLRSRATTPAK